MAKFTPSNWRVRKPHWFQNQIENQTYYTRSDASSWVRLKKKPFLKNLKNKVCLNFRRLKNFQILTKTDKPLTPSLGPRWRFKDKSV